MTDKRTQGLIDRGWYRAAKERIESNPSGDVEVSEETKQFIQDRIGRIQFASAGQVRSKCAPQPDPLGFIEDKLRSQDLAGHKDARRFQLRTWRKSAGSTRKR